MEHTNFKAILNSNFKGFLLPACLIAVIAILSYSFIQKENNTRNEPLKNSLKDIKAHPLILKADSLLKVGQAGKSIDLLKKGSKTFEEQQAWDHYLFVLNRLGETMIGQRQADSALYYLRAFQKAGGNETSTAKILHAQIYYNLGNAYDLKFIIDSALYWHKKALDLRMSVPGSDNIAVVKSCGQIGNIYRYKKNDFYNAEKYYTKQLNLLQKMPGYHYLKASCYYNLAATYDLKYDFENALTFSFKALEKADDLEGDSAVWFREYCYTALGNAYNSKRSYKKARSFYLKAIASIKERKGEDDPSLINKYYNAGQVYYSIGLKDSASHYAEQALSILHPLYKADPDVRLRNNMINCYILKGMAFSNNFNRSVSYYKKALRLVRNNDHDLTRINIKTGRLYNEHQQPDSALFYFQKAIEVNKFQGKDLLNNPKAGDILHSRHSLIALKGKASVLKEIYDKTHEEKYLLSAFSAYQIIDTVLNNYKSSFLREGSKLYLSEINQFNFDNRLDCVFELYKLQKEKTYIDATLAFIEKSKYSILLENLTKAEFKNTAGIPASIKEAENNLATELAFLKSRLNNTSNDSTVRSIQNKIYRITTKQDSLVAFFKEHYPNYFQYKYDDHIIDLTKAQNEARKKDAIFLEYYWGDHAAYGLAIYKDGYKLVRIGKDRLLEDQLREFKKQLSSGIRMNSLQEDFQTYTASSFSLYEQLVLPLVKDRKEKNIIVIPHGELAYIPFEALLTNTSDSRSVNYKALNYLAKEFTISYAYSLSLLLNQTHHIEKTRERRLLALSYGNVPDQHASLQFKRNGNLQDLPGSVQELKAIAEMMEGEFLSGSEATESAFKKNVAKSDIIHLALHNINDTLNPLNSKLVFRNEADEKEDGFLHTYELYNLNLKGKLAVLSACESGIGKMEAGEGINSIGRGFTYAGCPAVLISLWKIQDESTARFMQLFYKSLLNDQYTDVALSNARHAYLKNADELTAHPSNWAAFIIYGNTEFPAEDPSHYFWIIIIAVTGIVIALYFLYKNLPGKRSTGNSA